MSTGRALKILVNEGANMSRGKYAAQAVHAALLALDAHHDGPVIVLGGSTKEINECEVRVFDAGRTEVAPNTLTAGVLEAPESPIAAAEARGYRRAAADIAERIRAELVCCDIYDQDAGTNRAGRTHGICFWGEASARLAEEVAATGVAGSDSGVFTDAVEVVEARGRAKAIADLRDTAAYRMWQAKNHLYYDGRAELIAYLETAAKDPES